jgi:hypothetical protein
MIILASNKSGNVAECNSPRAVAVTASGLTFTGGKFAAVVVQNWRPLMNYIIQPSSQPQYNPCYIKFYLKIMRQHVSIAHAIIISPYTR